MRAYLPQVEYVGEERLEKHLHGKGRQRGRSMTSGHQDEAFFRQRGFGLKIGFGERPALIVIDMIKAFTNPGHDAGLQSRP